LIQLTKNRLTKNKLLFFYCTYTYECIFIHYLIIY